MLPGGFSAAELPGLVILELCVRDQISRRQRPLDQPVTVSLSGILQVLQAELFLRGPGVLAGGLTRQAYSITETAPLFCRHRKNKRRALGRVQEAHLPDSLGPDPPWAYAASASATVPSLRLQPSISLCLITFVLASAVGRLHFFIVSPPVSARTQQKHCFPVLS